MSQRKSQKSKKPRTASTSAFVAPGHLNPLSSTRQEELRKWVEVEAASLRSTLGLPGKMRAFPVSEERRLQLQFFMPSVRPTEFRKAMEQQSMQGFKERLHAHLAQSPTDIPPDEESFVERQVELAAQAHAKASSHLGFVADYLSEALSVRGIAPSSKGIPLTEAPAILRGVLVRIRLEQSLQRASVDPTGKEDPWLAMALAAIKSDCSELQQRFGILVTERTAKGDSKLLRDLARMSGKNTARHPVQVLLSIVLDHLLSKGRLPTKREVRDAVEKHAVNLARNADLRGQWVTFPDRTESKRWKELFRQADLHWLPPGKPGRPPGVHKTSGEDSFFVP